MESKEFRPALVTVFRVLLTPFLLLFTFVLFWIIANFISQLPRYFSNSENLGHMFISLVGVFGGWFLLFSLTFLNPLSTKVRVDKDSLVFLNRFLFGSWTERKIKFSNIERLDDKEEWNYRGKTIWRSYSLIVTYKDSTKEEINMNAWDMGTVFKIIHQIKQLHPILK